MQTHTYALRIGIFAHVSGKKQEVSQLMFGHVIESVDAHCEIASHKHQNRRQPYYAVGYDSTTELRLASFLLVMHRSKGQDFVFYPAFALLSYCPIALFLARISFSASSGDLRVLLMKCMF